MSYIVFTDNIKNYENGVYNGKTLKDKGDKNTCLAILAFDDEGNTVRKMLFNPSEASTAIFQASFIKVNKNEYAWMGFKNGTAKVITLTLE